MGNIIADPLYPSIAEVRVLSDEARRRYVDWLYRRFLGRPPTAAEAAPWLDLLARGADRRQVFDGVAALRPR